MLDLVRPSLTLSLMPEPTAGETHLLIDEVDASISYLRDRLKYGTANDILEQQKEVVFSCQRMITYLTLPRE